MNYQFLSQLQDYHLLDEQTTYNLFKAYKSGDLTAEKQLVLHNIRLVIYIQRTYDASLCDDDMTQMGIIGLIKAVKNFDIEKQSRFVSFASTCIRNEILAYLKKQKKLQNEFSLSFETEINNDNGDTYTYEDVLKSPIPTPEQEYIASEEQEILAKLIDTLQEPNKQIMMAFYGFNGICYTQQEISQMIGLSQSYISRIIKRSTNDIKSKYLKLT